MKIVIMDGQGGGLGKLLVETLLQRLQECPTLPREKVEIYAMGSNSIATTAMVKAGADFGATGENAVIRNVQDANCILGPVGIALAHGILGEITPNMAEAVAGSRGRKFLVPMNHCGTVIVGVEPQKLSDYAQQAVNLAVDYCETI